MKFPSIFKAAAMSATAAAAATLALTAQADSFTSSASSAGSASSGSVSTSLNGSSNSSSGDNKTAGGPYHIIQMAAAPGKANTTRTLGDVMKESIEAARTVVRSRSARLGIKPEVFEKSDIHIHVPEGATPKDGPSARAAMTTAFVSALTGIPGRADVAMT
eukprot:gene37610-42599_t